MLSFTLKNEVERKNTFVERELNKSGFRVIGFPHTVQNVASQFSVNKPKRLKLGNSFAFSHVPSTRLFFGRNKLRKYSLTTPLPHVKIRTH